MSNLNRRRFLKLLGQGAAVLSMGFPGRARASGRESISVSKNTRGKYQIFYPYEYLDWEKGIIEERFEQADKGPQQGMGPPGGGPREISEADILKYNRTWDPYNPLFNDRDYAKSAGYPGVPAWPCFQSPGAMGGVSPLPKDMADNFYYANDGSDIRVWTHIFAGDSFTSEIEKIEFEDITAPGSDVRMFKLGSSGIMYNAKSEQVGWGYNNKREAYKKIIDGSPGPSFTENMSEWVEDFPPPHYTTDEEWEYIFELWDKEYIRGSQKLYWEDVNIGDEPTWTCSGPISHIDLIGWGGFNQRGLFMRDNRDNMNTLFRDKYGQYLRESAIHFGNRNIPGSRAVFHNTTGAQHITRMLTNYIGDAGLVTRVCWMFKQLFKEMQEERTGGEYLDKVPYMKGKGCTIHGSEGDTIIAKGYVTDKYINDRGGHSIDLTCWAETLDNRIVQVVAASAKLPSKRG